MVVFVTRKSIDNKVLKEKRSQGLSPKSKPTAILLSVFFGFWSWLYTYKINFKKFWIGFSIIFFFLISVTIIILQSDPVIVFSSYGTWLWLMYLLSNGSLWLWALLDNLSKPTDFYLNYPESFKLKKNETNKNIIIKEESTSTKKVDDNNIFCMRCGTKLPPTAIYCKKCGQKVE